MEKPASLKQAFLLIPGLVVAQFENSVLISTNTNLPSASNLRIEIVLINSNKMFNASIRRFVLIRIRRCKDEFQCGPLLGFGLLLLFLFCNGFHPFDFGHHPEDGLFDAGAQCHSTHGTRAAGAMKTQLHRHVVADFDETDVAAVSLQVRAQLRKRFLHASS